MASIGDLGAGYGYVYVVRPNGTDILSAIENLRANTLQVKMLGVHAMSIGANRKAVGSFTFTVAPSGAGAVTAVNVNGVQQMLASVSYAGATTVSVLASDVATQINSLSAASGTDYTAIAVAGTVYLIAAASGKTTVNGHTVAVTVTTNPPTVTTSNMAGGTDSNDVYDTTVGFRFYLNANYDSNGIPNQTTADADSLTNAVEITNYVVMHGLQGALNNESVTIASGVISPTRKALMFVVIVDTEGAAATDNLDYITPIADFTDNDIMILRGAATARVVTLTSTGNINTNGSFSTGDKDVSIMLQYLDGTWYERARSGFGAASVTQFRADNFPFLSNTAYGNTAITAADNTTVTLTVNSSTRVQTVTGTASLTTGDYTITFSTTGAVKGDEFHIRYNGLVTIGSYQVVIGGRTLTANEALLGGLILNGYYDGSAWITTIYYDYNQAYLLATANVGDNQITAAKVEDNLTYDTVIMEVSFETGEVGDFKFTFNYPCTVTTFYAYATKAIAATDAATITPKNNAGTTLTGSTLTFAASDARGTAVTSTATANNTFIAGDVMTLTAAKTTAGGKATVSFKVTRT